MALGDGQSIRDYLRRDNFEVTIHGDKVSAYYVGIAVLGTALVLYLFVDAYVAWRRERRIAKIVRRHRPNGDSD